MAENIILKVDFQGADVTSQKAIALATNINKLGAEKRELAKKVKDLDVNSKTYAQDLAKLTGQQNQVNAQIKVAKKEYADLERATINATIASRAENGSLQQQRAELASAQAQWVRLSAAQRQNSVEGQALKARIDELDASVKGNEESIGIHNRSVGDYGKALNGLTPYLGQFGSQITAVQGLLGTISESLKNFSISGGQSRTVVQGFGKAATDTSGSITGMVASTNGATAATATYNTVQQTTNGTVKEGRTVVTGYAQAQNASATATKAASTASGGFSKALKILKVALISTGIGAIVVALGSLIAAFASTQAGSDKLRRFMAPLKEIFGTIFGVIQDVGLAVMDAISLAIEKPGEAWDKMVDTLESGWNFLKDVVINPTKAGFSLMASTIEKGILEMRIAWNNFTGDAEEAQALEDELKMVEAEIQESLKTIEKGQQVLAEAWNDIADAAADAQKKMQEAYDRGLQIDDLTQQIERLESTENLRLGRLKRERLAQKEIAEDLSKTNAERSAAAKREIELLEESTRIESDILDKKIERMKLEQMANDTSLEEQKELNDLIAEREEIEATLSEQRIEVSKRLFATNKAQTDALKKQAEEAAKAEVKTKADAIDKEMKLTELAHKLDLAQTEKTNEEIYQAEVDLQKRLFDLKIEKAKLAGEDTVVLEKEKNLALAELDRAERDRKAKEAEDKAKEDAKKKEEEDKKAAELQKEQDAKDLELRKAKNDLAFKFAEELNAGLIERANKRNEEEKQREVEKLQAQLEAGIISQEQFDQKREEIDRKAFKRKKRIDTAEVLTNAIVAASKTIAQLGFANPALPFALAGIGVQTAAQVTGIQAQTFASGGFTGPGNGTTDHTGHSPVGIVHDNEFVASKRTLSTPLGMGLANMLDGINRNPALGYYAEGGFTTRTLQVDNESIAAALSGQMQQIKVVNVASETAYVDGRTKFVKNKGVI